MEFYRWILIATGLVLLGVAFLMGRKKTRTTVVRRTNVVKPGAGGTLSESAHGATVHEPVHDPLNGGMVADSPADHYDQADEMTQYRDEQFDSNYAEPESNYDESIPTGSVQNDGFEEIDLALDNGSYRGNQIGQTPSESDPVKVTSFASAVQAANAQDEILATGIEEFDNGFHEEFESYNGPVQLGDFEEKLVSIHVVALSGRRFYGKDLKALFDKHGYTFGRMSLYHCALEGEKVFSIANMVKPGTFDEEQMRIFETPGITLFMRLPIDLDSDVAFDFLIQEAKELADELDGQLRDGNRNPLSEQTIQHMREDMQQYVFRSKQVLQPVV